MENLKNSDYVSLREIANGYGVNSKWASNKWLSQPNTLEYIQLWEKTHNLKFDNCSYLQICTTSLAYGQSPTIKELKTKANIICMFTDKDDFENIYLHKDIAMDFAGWLSPAFQNYITTIFSSNAKKFPGFNSSSDFIISDVDYASFLKRVVKEQIKTKYNQSSKPINEGYNYKMIATVV